jgi:hypothetical protein
MEVEQSINGELLRKQFKITYENLKPLKLIENSLRDIVTSPKIGNSLLGATLGIAAGFLTKKIAVGKSHNIFRILFGSFLELGVTKAIALHPEAIKSAANFLFEQIRSKIDPPVEENEQDYQAEV